MPSRKRKKSPPNRTLLDFFPGADAVKREKISASQKQKSGTWDTVASREIIVINSDNEDDLLAEKGKRRAHSGAPQSLDVIPAFEEGNAFEFGAPSRLLGSEKTSCPKTRKDISERPTLGVSVSLCEQASVGPVAWCGSIDDAVAESLATGEWAASDDILVTPDGAVEIEKDRDEDEYFESICPVCEANLTGILILDAQAHINQCLDDTLQDEDFIAHGCSPIATKTQPHVRLDNYDTSALEKGQRENLYTVLMNSQKEEDHWVEADVAADRDFRPTSGNRRRTPFYKVLQGMPIAVDAFCYGTIPGVTAYFLTHAHSDHYTNLGFKWKSGPIYCSEETASLIIHMLAVDPLWIHPIPLDTPTTVPNTGGVTVTLIEANHCPGSCLFLFEGQQTIEAGDSTFKSPFIGSSRYFRYLHCGDFRASPRHVLHPAVKGKHIDLIYLDTTYLDPKYMFSPQPLVISACAELARRMRVAGGNGASMNRNSTIDAWMNGKDQEISQDRILVAVGTYSIGKERIVKAIAQALETKIYCDQRKYAILRCQADDELHNLLTANASEADVHMLPLGAVTPDNLRLYLQRFKGIFSRVIGFRPTGWNYSPPPGGLSNTNPSVQSIISCGQSRHFSFMDLKPSQKSSYNIQIFGVPYSEHSSFFELTCFAMSCDWGRIIPTVNIGTPSSRAKMAKWLKQWELARRVSELSFIQPRTPDYW